MVASEPELAPLQSHAPSRPEHLLQDPDQSVVSVGSAHELDAQSVMVQQGWLPIASSPFAAVEAQPASPAEPVRDPHSWAFQQKQQFFETGEAADEEEQEAEHEAEHDEASLKPGTLAGEHMPGDSLHGTSMSSTKLEATASSTSMKAGSFGVLGASSEELEVFATTLSTLSSAQQAKGSLGQQLVLGTTASLEQTTQGSLMSIEQTTQGSLMIPSASSSKMPSASSSRQGSPANKVLEFGPRDPAKDILRKSIKKRSRTGSEASFMGEDISVEELRAQLVFLRKEEESEKYEATEENAASMSTAYDVQTDRLDSHASASSSAVAVTNVGRLSVASSTTSVGDFNEGTAALTQEITTTCVRDLLRDSRSSKPSRNSSVTSMNFDEPTYTMLDVQREVLGLFADSPKGTSPCSNADAQEVPSRQGMSSQPVSSFEVFQETEVEQPVPRQLLADMGSSSPLRGIGGAVRQFGQPSDGLTIWTDTEFDG